MSSFQFLKMTEQYAALIAGWTYEEPYSLYSMEGLDDISELMNGDYYYALDDTHELVGYICTGNSARVPGGYPIGIYNDEQYIDLGLGLKPELTGKGFGEKFLFSSLQFIKEEYDKSDVQLVVAAFNERAIKVYERVGFIKGQSFKSKVSGQEIDFLVMNYSTEFSPNMLEKA
ncbi:GNAT family N-acetyltransferase [Paenibacillus ihbetae]|uniref:GNAT family N-acetyltransferase n=1 Tax=Paenibacillus ihbetae TaxID=1870820 RepID=A0ABX3JYM6_9BACL|nr:GNAT family protein [Paenibacillus ihbetae]OOC62560.1 GNAT family N-acetyltransferase [Paenibacillus ihbetae]